MMGHKIRFKGEIWKITGIPKLPLSPLLIWRSDFCHVCAPITAINIGLNCHSHQKHHQCIHLFADIVRVRYFRDLLSSESERLRKLCKVWDDYNNFTEDLTEEGGYNDNSIHIEIKI